MRPKLYDGPSNQYDEYTFGAVPRWRYAGLPAVFLMLGRRPAAARWQVIGEYGRRQQEKCPMVDLLRRAYRDGKPTSVFTNISRRLKSSSFRRCRPETKC